MCVRCTWVCVPVTLAWPEAAIVGPQLVPRTSDLRQNPADLPRVCRLVQLLTVLLIVVFS